MLVDERFELLRELGRSPSSQVFEALDRESGERVALKLISAPALSRRAVSARMLAELRRVAAFEHPGAVRVLHAFEWQEQIAIAAQRVDGTDLASQIAASGPLDAEQAVSLASQLARALAAAHARGILHRNVKPSNVLLGDDGRARLLDFGCAHVEGQALLCDVDEPVTTVAFLPPEIVAGRNPDSRSDLYALGMTLYFALVGHAPWASTPSLPPAPRSDGHRPAELRPELPPWLDELVARLTAAQPSDRFATALDVVAALERRSSGRSMEADPRLLDVCVVCRQPGTLGLAICPHCEDTSDEADDSLVVLEPAADRGTSEDRSRRLAGLSDQHAASALLGWTAAGRLPLVRVSERQARRIVGRLAIHGLPARRIPVDTAWCLVPRWVSAAAAAIGVTAWTAGLSGHPYWLCVLLLLAGLLGPAATALLQHVALLPRRIRPRPAQALVSEVNAVMPRLETGEARHLLVDCLRLGRAIDERAERAGLGPQLRPSLVGALISACDAARELASLDPCLGALRLHGPRRFELPQGLVECRALIERARSGLVQALLDTTAALSQLRGQEVLDGAASSAELERRKADLADARSEASDLAKDGIALFAARH
jgi:hypothetical protein